MGYLCYNSYCHTQLRPPPCSPPLQCTTCCAPRLAATTPTVLVSFRCSKRASTCAESVPLLPLPLPLLLLELVLVLLLLCVSARPRLHPRPPSLWSPSAWLALCSCNAWLERLPGCLPNNKQGPLALLLPLPSHAAGLLWCSSSLNTRRWKLECSCCRRRERYVAAAVVSWLRKVGMGAGPGTVEGPAEARPD